MSKMNKLNVVTVGGSSFLGKVTEEDGKVLLINAFPSSANPDKDDFVAYLKAKNLGQLKSKVFGGNGVDYNIDKLTKPQKIDLKICVMLMKQAKITAASLNENGVFNDLLGK